MKMKLLDTMSFDRHARDPLNKLDDDALKEIIKNFDHAAKQGDYPPVSLHEGGAHVGFIDKLWLEDECYGAVLMGNISIDPSIEVDVKNKFLREVKMMGSK